MSLNGEPLDSGAVATLTHNDRLLIGDATFFRYCDGQTPDLKGAGPSGSVGIVFDWQYAHDECEVRAALLFPAAHSLHPFPQAFMCPWRPRARLRRLFALPVARPALPPPSPT